MACIAASFQAAEAAVLAEAARRRNSAAFQAAETAVLAEAARRIETAQQRTHWSAGKSHRDPFLI